MHGRATGMFSAKILEFVGRTVRTPKGSCCITDCIFFCTDSAIPAFFWFKKVKSSLLYWVNQVCQKELRRRNKGGKHTWKWESEKQTAAESCEWGVEWDVEAQWAISSRWAPMVVIIEKKTKQALVFQQLWYRNTSNTATCIIMWCYKSDPPFFPHLSSPVQMPHHPSTEFSFWWSMLNFPVVHSNSTQCLSQPQFLQHLFIFSLIVEIIPPVWKTIWCSSSSIIWD